MVLSIGSTGTISIETPHGVRLMMEAAQVRQYQAVAGMLVPELRNGLRLVSLVNRLQSAPSASHAFERLSGTLRLAFHPYASDQNMIKVTVKHGMLSRSLDEPSLYNLSDPEDKEFRLELRPGGIFLLNQE